MDIMKIKIWLISAVILGVLSSCDDGDLIFTSFDFEDQALNFCGGESSLVFFKINDDTQEAIALNIEGTSEMFLQEEIPDINLSATNFVTFRSFNGTIDASYFCSSVPPSTPEVTNEFLAENGVARLINNLVLDDEDDVPQEIELVIDEDTDLPLDTDEDGIPDYFDFDDDGDNVPTIFELISDNEDGDDNPLTPIKDTDQDGIPDYLDPDDDGDGILTRNESTDGNLSPIDDVNDPSSGIPDFLNMDVAIPGFNNQEFILHIYNRNAAVDVILFDVRFFNGEEMNTQETLDLGGVLNVINETVQLTPEF